MNFNATHGRNKFAPATKVPMNQHSSSQKTSFKLRRYATRLGRRYALSAASVVMLGFSVAGYSKLDASTSLFTTSPSSIQQQLRDPL